MQREREINGNGKDTPLTEAWRERGETERERERGRRREKHGNGRDSRVMAPWRGQGRRGRRRRKGIGKVSDRERGRWRTERGRWMVRSVR